MGSSSQGGGSPSGHPLRQRQDVECRQVAELVLPPRENDHRLCVVEHVGDQGVGQRGIEEHHGAASLENAEVRGHDLPVVLRHGHGHDLVGTCEEGRKGCGHALRSRVEFSEGQGFSGVGNLQGREMRKLLGGAAEDFCEPPDSFLMRYVHEVAVAKDIRQAVWAGVRLPGDFSAAQRYRLQATNVSAKKTATAVAAKLLPKLFLTCS